MSKFRRLTPLIALAAAIALLVTGILVVYSGERAYREQQGNELKAEARILASTVIAALAFADHAAAQTYVRALDANPQIEAAAVYDSSGGSFAEYRRYASADLPRNAPIEGLLEVDGRIVVTVPVVQDQAAVGSVYVRGVLAPLAQRIERYAAMAVMVVMAMLLTAVLGIAQVTSTRNNRQLAEANARLQTQITEREKAEEALRQAQKMEAIGQLTGGIAHDFNNILQVILGNLGTVQHRLQQGSVDPNRILRAVDTAIRGGERAAVLVAQLLAFSRRQPLEPKSLEVNRLVSGMSELLHRSLGETIDIETVFSARLWPVLADANQLESALLNLAVNARDAMPEGGKLTIETANAYLDEVYTASEEGLQAGQYVVIAVSDTGTGMPAEVVAKAFDPFYTTKESDKEQVSASAKSTASSNNPADTQKSTAKLAKARRSSCICRGW